MTHKFEEGKDIIIDTVIHKLQQDMAPDQAHLCSEFVRQFYSTVALDDLREWSTDDLYGAALNFWSLIKQRSSKETKIRIYNPDFERHGWQTTHTVIEVITEDMPFLVDSIRMVVNRMGFMSYLIVHMGGIHLQRSASNEVTAIYPQEKTPTKDIVTEAPIFLEIDRQTDPRILEELRSNIERVLNDNRAIFEDWLAR